MGFIWATILALISGYVSLNRKHLAGENHQQKVGSISMLIALLASFLAVYRLAYRSVVIIPAGRVGVVETWGKVSDQVLNSGINLVNPFSKTVEFSTRLKDVKETVSATSLEGLNLELDVSLQYRLQPQEAIALYKNIGINEEEILISRFRSIIREITSSYEVKAIYGNKRQEITQLLQTRLSQQLNPLGLIVEESLLRKVILPEKVQTAIQQKIEAQQQSEQQQFINQKNRQVLEFELEKAQQEAERKRIEAQGIAEANRLISQGLTTQVLELKAIEASQKLAESPNSKLVIIGRNRDGLPLLLQNE